MVTKEKVLSAINEMPNEFDLDDFIERLIFMEKVEEGLQQVEKGQGLSHEEVRRKVQSWGK